MKYPSPSKLVEAHVADIIESSDGTYQVCATIAQATLVSILMTAHEGDTEKVIEDLDQLIRYVKAGIDSGELQYMVYQ